MRLIVVTRESDGKKVYVNPEQVCAVYPYFKQEDKTVIQFSGAENNYFVALESAESIANMITNKAEVMTELKQLPPTQPERIRGRWVKDEEASNLHVEPIYICSACNNMDAWGETEKNTFKFCPNCGADMQEGGENATD